MVFLSPFQMRKKSQPLPWAPVDDEAETGDCVHFEAQFRNLYEMSADPERKAFLDGYFTFMQKRGTPVGRIPIMAKQVLDLFELYRLVVARGGLLEVIEKKIWKDIMKGLNLPSSITSAAFTLRTQYMKYLYPYECEKENLSTPEELQQAIDGNRREGRRSSNGNYPDMIGSPVGASGCPGGSGEGIPGPSHHQQQLYPQEALCPVALVTNNRNGGSNDSHNGKSTPIESMDESESIDEDSMPAQAYSNAILSFAQAQTEPINLGKENEFNHNQQLPSSSNNHNNELFFSMTFNDIIYSGILYATHTGKP